LQSDLFEGYTASPQILHSLRDKMIYTAHKRKTSDEPVRLRQLRTVCLQYDSTTHLITHSHKHSTQTTADCNSGVMIYKNLTQHLLRAHVASVGHCRIFS